MSGSVAGKALRAYFNERLLGVLPANRMCQGVLVLPDRRSDYLRGGHRRGLRKKLRRAANAGITCEVVRERSDAVEAFEVIARTRRQGPFAPAAVNHFRSLSERPEMTLLVARDGPGSPIAVVAAVIDEKVCLIEWASSNSHEARWALHDHLVDVVMAWGVKYLFARGEGPFGALGFPTSVQDYQHVLGYELRHVIFERPLRLTFRRRLVAAVLVVAASVAVIAPRAAASTEAPAPVNRTTPHHLSQALPGPANDRDTR
jgi:hypothetical protein